MRLFLRFPAKATQFNQECVVHLIATMRHSRRQLINRSQRKLQPKKYVFYEGRKFCSLFSLKWTLYFQRLCAMIPGPSDYTNINQTIDSLLKCTDIDSPGIYLLKEFRSFLRC